MKNLIFSVLFLCVSIAHYVNKSVDLCFKFSIMYSKHYENTPIRIY